MLTASRRGYSLSTVMARGFAFEMLQGLVRVGLASTNRDAVGVWPGQKLPICGSPKPDGRRLRNEPVC
jgi:hypothetical protein